MTFYKKKRFWAIIIIVFLLGYGVFAQMTKEDVLDYVSVSVERRDLVSSVSETGKITNSDLINLQFEKSAKVIEVLVEDGQEVKKDDVLARVDGRSSQVLIAQYEAELKNAQASLALKKAGAQVEDIAVSQKNVESALLEWENAKIDTQNVILQQKAEVEKQKLLLAQAKKELNAISSENTNIAVKNAYDAMRITLASNIIKLRSVLQDTDEILGVDDQSINDAFEDLLARRDFKSLTDAQNAFIQTQGLYDSAQSRISSLNSTSSYQTIDEAVILSENALLNADELLVLTRTVLNASLTGPGLTQTQLDTFKATVDTQKTTINTERNTLETKRQAILTAQSSYDVLNQKVEIAQQNLDTTLLNQNIAIQNANDIELQKEIAYQIAQASLDLKKAAPRKVDLAGLEAQIEQVRARLNSAYLEYEKSVLKAPFDGVIGNIDIEVGQTISLNQDVMTLYTDVMEIELDIPESDIAKIKLGQQAEVTLDAFGDDFIITAQITKIGNLEKTIGGVIYYPITLQFSVDEDTLIKSGMTANVFIETKRVDNALVIPIRAIFTKDNKKYVRVATVKNNVVTLTEKHISTGMIGDAGFIEVISGLNEGEEVVTFINEEE